MPSTVVEYKKEILKGIENLSSEKMKEVLDFVWFIKVKEAIDPTQVYFWTKRWQDMEKEADADKGKGRVVGDGTAKDLIKKLKK